MNQKHKFFADFAKIYQDIKTRPYCWIIPFEADEVLDFPGNSVVPEMHDRIIVGIAHRLDVPLITVDSLITSAGIVQVEW